MRKKGTGGIRTAVFVLFCTIFLISPCFAQFNHPELNWKVIETPNFLIHFHQDEKNFAHYTAKIAEQLYEKTTSVIGYQPSRKIPVVIRNYNDQTGGYTSVFTNKIVIEAQSDPHQTSGTLPWPAEVLGHELVHYISFAAIDESLIPLRKAMANLTLPMWFIEGLAQYVGEEWDPWKNMVVGDQARHGQIFSEGNLGAFYFFTGWGRLSGYYQSNSLVKYIFETYGEEKISEIFENLRKQPLLRVVGVVDTTGGGAVYPLPRFINFDKALKKAVGKNSIQLYREWKNQVTEKYQQEQGANSLLKNALISFGQRAQSPHLSPDGNYVAFVSNKRYDFAIFDLYLFNLSTKKIKRLATGVNPYFCFSPGGKFIVYSKTAFYAPKRCFLSDLYKTNLSTGRTTRLTHGERAFQPTFSPEGDSIVFVKKKGGNSNLYVLNLPEEKISPLTNHKDGVTQNFSPSFSPKGNRVVFVQSKRGIRNIYLLNMHSKKIHPLTQDKADDRNPIFLPDGERIMFISTKIEKGIEEKISRETFNLWSLNLKDGKRTKHTRVRGGIFDPAVSPNGEKIVFSGYKKGRFSIYLFPLTEILCQKFPQKPPSQKKSPPAPEKTEVEKREIIAEINLQEEPPKKKTYSYTPQVRLHYIFPWFSISERNSFFSLEFLASDVLEKHQLMGTAYFSENTQYELAYVNRSFTPTLWMNIYHQEGWSSFKRESYSVKITGQSGGVYYPLSDSILLSLGYSQQKTESSLFTPTLELVPWEGKIRTINAELTYSNLNPVRSPQLLPWGRQIRLGAEWSDEKINSELSYLSWYANLKNYLRLSENNSFALRLTGKRVKNKKEPIIVYSLQGGKQVRGYPQDFLDRFAGENLVAGSLEYRFILKKRIGGSSSFYVDSVGGALFYDAGATWRKQEKLTEDDIYKDAGIEFRARILPFGKYPLIMRLGIAWPFDYDRKGRFFLSLGGVF